MAAGSFQISNFVELRNPYQFMQKVFFILFFSIVSANLLAQQVYFVTIEADNKQPFSVQIGSKNYSSTPIGHLIIPNLKDNTYLLTIRFPRNEGSDQTFSINVNKKDKGYQLKKIGIRNWGLFDWQTMELIKPNSVDLDLSVNEKDIEKSKDAFARMMAAVVNDSAVLFSERPKPVLVRKTAEVKEIDQVSPEKANQITTDVRDSTFVVSGIPISNQLDSTISKDQKEGSKENSARG